MGDWDRLVDELVEAIEEDFDPEDRYHDRLTTELVDSMLPHNDRDIMDLALDNREIFRFETELGHNTPEDIMIEAIYSLLSNEAYRIIQELESEVETCLECSARYLPSKSEAEDHEVFCSGDCEFEYNAINCDMCHNKYLESESTANEPDRFCDADCEHEYETEIKGDENDNIGELRRQDELTEAT